MKMSLTESLNMKQDVLMQIPKQIQSEFRISFLAVQEYEAEVLVYSNSTI